MANLVVWGVAGASLSEVDAAESYISNTTILAPPPVGKPANLIAILAALLSTPVCFIVALMRIRQIRHPHVADREAHGIINYFVSTYNKSNVGFRNACTNIFYMLKVCMHAQCIKFFMLYY